MFAVSEMQGNSADLIFSWRWRACFELGLEAPCSVNAYTDQKAAALQAAGER
ncbi:hypothetical protein GCM10011348_07590 [Marinobacterium nitratireducens]|uniref:Uncharacterized protein n=1 Tax=Marinobacterium nitratireducens TaxID=518897 RepID=A0A918DQN2_9GAMM|nr:hypothetical protein GCM10011348_07590 [Marinobacterium nitratireducens]